MALGTRLAIMPKSEAWGGKGGAGWGAVVCALVCLWRDLLEKLIAISLAIIY